MTESNNPGQSKKSSWLSGVDLPVTVIAGGITILFLIMAMAFTAQVRVSGLHIFNFITAQFGWVFVLGTAGFVFLSLYLAFSRFGNVKIGEPDDEPQFSTYTWIAMMFALGVGIGLIFYGAYEPVLLYANPPPGGPEPKTIEAAIVAMQYSIFHWALHPWAFFGIAGLAFAYTGMNKKRPALASRTMQPLIGKSAEGNSGRAIDIWVIVTTLVGNAVTLGLGTLQIVAGLGYVAGLETSDLLIIIVIAVLTLGFIYSALAGVDSGIARLADFNTYLAIFLLLFVFVLGPLGFILELVSQAIGGYIYNFIPMAFQTAAFEDGLWMQNWTVFFWAWGISWAPYVGSFLAQISRGRTIREYVFGVLIAPSIATIVWFSVLGGTALELQMSGTMNLVGVASESAQAALFAVLGQFPIAIVTQSIVVILAAVFFVSGADAGAIVLGSFSSHGEEEPHTWLVIGWGLLVGLVALTLLVVGGLDALQWGALVVAAPFVIVLILMCVALVKDLFEDERAGRLSLPGSGSGKQAADTDSDGS